MNNEIREHLRALAGAASVMSTGLHVLADAKPEGERRHTCLIDCVSTVNATRVVLGAHDTESMREAAERVMRERNEARAEVERLKTENIAIRNAALDEVVELLSIMKRKSPGIEAYSALGKGLKAILALKTPPASPLTGPELAEKHGFKPHGKDPLTGHVSAPSPPKPPEKTYTQAEYDNICDQACEHQKACNDAENEVTRLTAERDEIAKLVCRGAGPHACVVADIVNLKASLEEERAEVSKLTAERDSLSPERTYTQAEYDALAVREGDVRRRLIALQWQVDNAGCAAANMCETTYECDATKPCGLCRLRGERDGAWNAAIEACMAFEEDLHLVPTKQNLLRQLLRPSATVLIPLSEADARVAAEREACASICDKRWSGVDAACLIRARSSWVK